MNKLQHFITISKYAGERFDLVQAGGGNSSVKMEDGTMLIKASGFWLSDVDADTGYSSVNNQQVLDIMSDSTLISITEKKQRETVAGEALKKTIVNSAFRPSIETFLHSFFAVYTLHTHPIVVNAVTCRVDWKEKLSGLFPDALFVPYATPGIDLAFEMKKQLLTYMQTHAQQPSMIFLQNHGLIVSSDDPTEVMRITDDVTQQLEQLLGVDFSSSRLTNQISRLINSVENTSLVAYRSEDATLLTLLQEHRDYFFRTPFYPDGLVYCGVKALELNTLTDAQPIVDFKATCYELPRVVLYQNNLFFVGINVKKARESEDVCKLQLLAFLHGGDHINYLPAEELQYLGNWEAETYRRTLKA